MKEEKALVMVRAAHRHSCIDFVCKNKSRRKAIPMTSIPVPMHPDIPVGTTRQLPDMQEWILSKKSPKVGNGQATVSEEV